MILCGYCECIVLNIIIIITSSYKCWYIRKLEFLCAWMSQLILYLGLTHSITAAVSSPVKQQGWVRMRYFQDLSDVNVAWCCPFAYFVRYTFQLQQVSSVSTTKRVCSCGFARYLPHLVLGVMIL